MICVPLSYSSNDTALGDGYTPHEGMCSEWSSGSKRKMLSPRVERGPLAVEHSPPQGEGLWAGQELGSGEESGWYGMVRHRWRVDGTDDICMRHRQAPSMTAARPSGLQWGWASAASLANAEMHRECRVVEKPCQLKKDSGLDNALVAWSMAAMQCNIPAVGGGHKSSIAEGHTCRDGDGPSPTSPSRRDARVPTITGPAHAPRRTLGQRKRCE